MQYPINDMDELFRKAAEAYPLNTGTADWEKLHARLTGDEQQEKQPPSTGRLRWLWVLLPFLLIGLRLNDIYVTGRLQATSPSSAPAPQVPAYTNAGSVAATHRPTAENPARSRQPAAWPPLSQSFGLTTAYPRQQPAWRVDRPAETPGSFTRPIPEGAVALQRFESPQGIPQDQLPVVTEEAGTGKFLVDSTAPDQTTPENAKAQKPGSQKKRFYAGIIGGPEISTVKFQQFSKVGFQAGVLLGYRLNDRVSVEAGVRTAKKYYYSTGEYFKAQGSYPPSYAKLLSVDGHCRMIEIPVGLRYTFNPQKANHWFATAGVSSYLMQGESYSLDYFYPSSGSVATHSYTYTDKEQFWLAALQLSVGYSLKTGSLGNLRIEPYYSLPLKGMGHGRLPVSSLGVRVGITVPQF